MSAKLPAKLTISINIIVFSKKFYSEQLFRVFFDFKINIQFINNANYQANYSLSLSSNMNIIFLINFSTYFNRPLSNIWHHLQI